jgi:hypothetical protein
MSLSTIVDIVQIVQSDLIVIGTEEMNNHDMLKHKKPMFDHQLLLLIRLTPSVDSQPM